MKGTKTTSSVQDFYNEFLTSRMVSYRLHPNARIEAAIAQIGEYISPHSRILDIGCGIGVVAEAIGRQAEHGQVWACDISERNIWYAQATVHRSNVAFRQIDVLNQFDALREWVTHPVDAITLIDVIEHIPPDERNQLITNLVSLLSPEGVLILTYPSPYYQAHLRENDPGELQIIDEVIHLTTIMDFANSNGLYVKHYSLCDVWLTNQYVHCVLGKSATLVPTPSVRESFVSRMKRHIWNRIDRYILLPRRKRKYLTDPFS